MKNIKKLFLIMACFFCTITAQAQSHTVTGKVVDAEGLELIGVNIFIKGSAGVGAISDLNGKYTIKVNNASKDILVFSYIGMRSQEVHVKGKKGINVTLQSDATALDEVVVVGYGTSKRSDLTGSVVSVKSEDLMKVPTSDLGQALAGRVAGVQVTQSEGAPGSSISIRVRGGISITQSNEPLYIIDGFPSEDGMASLDPAEVATIDILKDASATAIYGARGANGVVVITTKKGSTSESKMSVSFESYIGFKTLARKLPVLSTKEYVLLDYERSLAFQGEKGVTSFQSIYGSFLEIDENYGNRPGIDWQEETLGRTATSQNYRVRISGGNKELKYSLGYSYFKDMGAMVFSGNDKHNISFNITHKPSKRIQVNARISFDQSKIYGMGTSSGDTRFNKMEHILQYRPTIGIYGNDQDLLENEDKIIDDDSNPVQNPLLSASQETNDRQIRTFQANGGFTFNFTKNFSFRNSTGMRYQTTRNDVFYGELSSVGKRSSINGYIQYAENSSFQTSNVLNYEYKTKKHKLIAMLGQEWVSRWTRTMRANATNFPNNDIGLDDMSLGIPGAITSGVNYDDKLLSFFTRLNYSFADKYLLTATVRADGSSKFSKDNKWGIFPSISAAWRIGEEKFIKDLNLFSDLKLRVGYGMAGNNRIASYTSLELLDSTTYPNGSTMTPGYVQSSIASRNLQWESNNTLNVGLDVGFFGQRLTISPEFYVNESTQLLLNSRVPSSSGFTNIMRNIGKTQNIGVDLTISSTNIQSRNFTWTTNLNLSHNKNTIKALSGESYFLEEARFGYSQKTHKIEVGKPIGQFYGYKTLGLYQVADFNYDVRTQTYTLKDGIPCMGDRSAVQPGMWKFANTDGNDVIDENDMTVIGDANPAFYGGLNNTFSYKNFDMSIFFTFSYGAEVLNATKLTNTQAGKTVYNVLNLANSSKRWMTINKEGVTVTDPQELAALNAGKTVASIHDMEQGDKYIHSWAVEDASYLRLSNLTIGYNFPKKWIRKASIQNLRLYATGSNLFVWTPYSGFDPEVSTKGNNLTPGVDFGAYPRSRSYVFGLNITF